MSDSARPMMRASLGPLVEAIPATSIQLLPSGEFRARDGRPASIPSWRIDREIAARVIARADAQRTKYVIDYEHQTLKAEQNGKPAVAAGWFKKLEWREGQGLYAIDVEWTATARAMIEAREYRYLSPVMVFDGKSGEIKSIVSAALTNTPAIDGMAEVALSSLALDVHALEVEALTSQERDVIAALGLSEDAYVAVKSEQVNVAALRAGRPEAPDRDGLTELDRTVCARLGLDPQQFLNAKETMR